MEPKKCGRKRSLIRRIGSFLNLRPAPRFKYSTDVGESSSKEDKYVDNESDATDNSCLLVRISVLEKEVSELRCVVEKILNQISAKETVDVECQVDGPSINLSLQFDRDSSAPRKRPPPPPPPPTPPPLPSPSRILFLSEASQHLAPNSEMPFLQFENRQSFGDVIKDLGNVKLRHIERTASGSPVRHVPPPTGFSAILISALRRRYAAFHMKTPEKNTGEDYSVVEDNSLEFCHQNTENVKDNLQD